MTRTDPLKLHSDAPHTQPQLFAPRIDSQLQRETDAEQERRAKEAGKDRETAPLFPSTATATPSPEAQAVIDALRAIPNAYGRTDKAGIPDRGGELYRRTLADFERPAIREARRFLAYSASWVVLDALAVCGK